MSGGLDVVYDPQIFLLQRMGGISRYFSDLIGEFAMSGDLGVAPRTPFHAVNSQYLLGQVGYRAVPRPRRVSTAALHRLHARRSRTPCDVVHHTYYRPEFLDFGRPRVRVSTVHDMIPELYPEYFPEGNPHLSKREFVEASAAVICVSEATKSALAACYPQISGNVAVVPLGVRPGFAARALHPDGLPSQYLLFVGSRKLYKDFDVVLKAMSLLQRTRPGLGLVVAGGGPLDDAERGATSRLTDVVALGEVTDPHLAGLYSAAVAFVFSSRHEGFGLPTLEAMSCGTAVVLADTTVFREVADDAALYFKPGSAEQLAERVDEVMGKPGLRQRLVEDGRRRAGAFTWERTAAATAYLYRAAV